MTKKQQLKSFGIRFAITFTVLSLGYLIAVGLNPGVKQLTPTERYQRIQFSYRQLYLTTNSIAAFSNEGPGAAPALSELKIKLQNNRKTAESALKDAPKDYDTYHRDNALAILSRVDSALQQFSDHLNILNRVIIYNPSDDLGKLSITDNSLVISQRAKAAANGLTTALNGTSKGVNNTSGVSNIAALTPELQTALTTEIDCFTQLGAASSAGKTTEATAIRSRCIQAYPVLRQAAINDLQLPFQGDFQDALARSITELNKDIVDRLQNAK